MRVWWAEILAENSGHYTIVVTVLSQSLSNRITRLLCVCVCLCVCEREREKERERERKREREREREIECVCVCVYACVCVHVFATVSISLCVCRYISHASFGIRSVMCVRTFVKKALVNRRSAGVRVYGWWEDMIVHGCMEDRAT